MMLEGCEGEEGEGAEERTWGEGRAEVGVSCAAARRQALQRSIKIVYNLDNRCLQAESGSVNHSFVDHVDCVYSTNMVVGIMCVCLCILLYRERIYKDREREK
jgi:hypothetical protein